MKSMRIGILAILLLLLLAVLSACVAKARWEDSGVNLTVTSESEAEIALVGINTGNRSEAASNADNSPLEAGDTLGFRMAETRDYSFEVEVFDGADALLGSGEFTKDFSTGETVALYILDGENGEVLITDAKPERD